VIAHDDVVSLLGRTYFVAGQFEKAEQMAHEARKRIKDENSKDQMDLRILFGDLVAERRDPDQAIYHYCEALKTVGSDDAERSEIAARALFRRGMCRKRFNRVGAKNDLKKSAEVWRTLDEQLPASEAEWQILLLEGEVPVRQRLRLEKLSPPIRVETVRVYRDRLVSMPKGARGQRKELNDGYVNELVRQATENLALKHREW
jgi:tetratricopeptide (TPR) repeat protein